MKIDFREDKKIFLRMFLRLEAYCLLLSCLLGLAGWYAHDWFVGVKLLFGVFTFMQPFLFYAYKDVWLLVLRRK